MSEAPGALNAPNEIPVTIGERHAEPQMPEKNALGFDKQYYRAGLVTKPSGIKSPQSEIDQSRPQSLRAVRAELFKQIRKDRVDPHAALQEAHARDEIARQFLTQGEVAVDLPGLVHKKRGM